MHEYSKWRFACGRQSNLHERIYLGLCIARKESCPKRQGKFTSCPKPTPLLYSTLPTPYLHNLFDPFINLKTCVITQLVKT